MGAYGAPTPQAGVAPAPTGGGIFGALLGLLGGIAVIAGSFLAWMTVTPAGGEAQHITGWNLTDDAKIMVAIGALGLLGAVLFLAKVGGVLGRILMAAAAIAAVGLAAFDTYDILKRVPERADILASFPGGADIVGPEVGLIVVFVGGALLLLGALLARRKK